MARQSLLVEGHPPPAPARSRGEDTSPGWYPGCPPGHDGGTVTSQNHRAKDARQDAVQPAACAALGSEGQHLFENRNSNVPLHRAAAAANEINGREVKKSTNGETQLVRGKSTPNDR